MRQQEAEQEAARRNAEDERRDRFVFYALDHSAGMSEDAWEVEMRLRTDVPGPAPSAVPVGAGAAEAAAEPLAAPSEEEDLLEETRAFAPVEEAEAVAPTPAAQPAEVSEPAEALETVPVRVQPPAAERAADLDATVPAPPRRRRRPRLIQVWGAFVILVGLLFVAATLLLSVGLRDYTHFGALPTSIGIGLGLLAVGIGVALVHTA